MSEKIRATAAASVCVIGLGTATAGGYIASFANKVESTVQSPGLAKMAGEVGMYGILMIPGGIIEAAAGAALLTGVLARRRSDIADTTPPKAPPANS
jgi:uncharacterized membrane protein YphA (DoxX/SURF4 family)